MHQLLHHIPAITKPFHRTRTFGHLSIGSPHLCPEKSRPNARHCAVLRTVLVVLVEELVQEVHQDLCNSCPHHQEALACRDGLPAITMCLPMA